MNGACWYYSPLSLIKLKSILLSDNQVRNPNTRQQSCQLDRHPAGKPNAWRQLHFHLCQKQTSICSKTQNLLNRREISTGLKFRYFLLLSWRILKFWNWGAWENIPGIHLKGQMDGQTCPVADLFFVGYWALGLYSYRPLFSWKTLEVISSLWNLIPHW